MKLEDIKVNSFYILKFTKKTDLYPPSKLEYNKCYYVKCVRITSDDITVDFMRDVGGWTLWGEERRFWYIFPENLLRELTKWEVKHIKELFMIEEL